MQHVRLAKPDTTPITSAPPQLAPLMSRKSYCKGNHRPAKSVNQEQTDSTCILQRASGDQTRQLQEKPEELQPRCEPEKNLAVRLKKLSSEDW